MLHCLNILRINAYILYKEISKQRDIQIPKKDCHKKFIFRLNDTLITQAEDAMTNSPRKSKRKPESAPIKEPVSRVQVPSVDRLMIRFDNNNPSLKKFNFLCFVEGEHKRASTKQGKCKYFAHLYLKAKALGKDKADWPKVKKPMLMCSDFKVNLCREYFNLWHSREE